MSSLSPTAQKIQNLLDKTGLNLNVVESPDSTRTAQEAADRVGCEIGQIVKSLIFRGGSTDQPILVLTSGANRVDEKRINQYVGEDIQRADPEFVREVTGFAIGGVPPMGHPRSLKTYVDEDLMGYQTIWAAAGTPKAVFQLTPQDLLSLCGGQVVRVK
jgi:prolyl-tRNA editing enzyme YbaK/EbsC (Cys-tRNA(Pro) deacylase)